MFEKLDDPEHSDVHAEPFVQEFKATDLPKDFQKMRYFGKEKTRVLQENKIPGTVPENIRNVVIEQVGQQIFMENERPNKPTLEWMAYNLCKTYLGLKDTAKKVNPHFTLSEKCKFVPWVCMYFNL